MVLLPLFLYIYIMLLTGFDNEEEYVPLEYGGYIQKVQRFVY